MIYTKKVRFIDKEILLLDHEYEVMYKSSLEIIMISIFKYTVLPISTIILNLNMPRSNSEETKEKKIKFKNCSGFDCNNIFYFYDSKKNISFFFFRKCKINYFFSI